MSLAVVLYSLMISHIFFIIAKASNRGRRHRPGAWQGRLWGTQGLANSSGYKSSEGSSKPLLGRHAKRANGLKIAFWHGLRPHNLPCQAPGLRGCMRYDIRSRNRNGGGANASRELKTSISTTGVGLRLGGGCFGGVRRDKKYSLAHSDFLARRPSIGLLEPSLDLSWLDIPCCPGFLRSYDTVS